MKIAYYCQHVLGVGHFHRSLEICRALSCSHDVTMITGGRDIDIVEDTVKFFQLPGLMMDGTFNNLTPCGTSQTLAEVKNDRKSLLLQFFQKNCPDIFIVELYPFGRKAFRFELDPVLEGVKNKTLPHCLTICSLRDILVERSDRLKFEERIITTLNSLFDGLLIHGDKQFISLDETFSRTSDIEISANYTGYVTPKPGLKSRHQIRKELQIPAESLLIVASIGGGNVGSELLLAVASAFKHLQDNKLLLQIFTGPYADSDLLDNLQNSDDNRIRAERFTPRFPDWLAAADLSISMAGYNTCMNTIAAGVPALFYPFKQNQEQYLRVSRLADHLSFTLLQSRDLEPKVLADLISNQLKQSRFTSPVNLNGAANTVKQVEELYSAQKDQL